MKHHLILHIVAKLLIPFIVLFGLYVQFHGDFGPGGGFQAGVIVAAAFILYALVYDVETLCRVASPALLRFFMALGVLIYAGVGVATILLGSNFLDYDALSQTPLHGQHLGIMLVELGVGITVAAVMISIFITFAGRSDGGE